MLELPKIDETIETDSAETCRIVRLQNLHGNPDNPASRKRSVRAKMLSDLFSALAAKRKEQNDLNPSNK